MFPNWLRRPSSTVRVWLAKPPDFASDDGQMGGRRCTDSTFGGKESSGRRQRARSSARSGGVLARAMLLTAALGLLVTGTAQRAGAENKEPSGAGTANVQVCEAAGGIADVTTGQTGAGWRDVYVACNGGLFGRVGLPPLQRGEVELYDGVPPRPPRPGRDDRPRGGGLAPRSSVPSLRVRCPASSPSYRPLTQAS